MKIKNQPKVSIVFVTWNGKEDTLKLLASLKKIAYKNYDIICVDNGSRDGTEEEVKKICPDVHFIQNKENLGLPAAINIGIEYAFKHFNPKYIYYMNNDMTVDKKFLDYLVEEMEENPMAAIAGPKIYYMDEPDKIWTAGCKFTIRGFIHYGQDQKDSEKFSKKRVVDGIDGTLFMRSSVLKELGLLEARYFLCQELTEFALRIKKKGYRALFVPKSKIYHKVNASFEKNKVETSSLFVYTTTRNWLLAIKKNKGFFYFLIVLLLYLFPLALIRIIKSIIRKNIKPVKAHFLGILDGILENTPQPYKRLNIK